MPKKHEEIPFRRYSAAELNALLEQLRAVLVPNHPPSVCLLMAMVLLAEVANNVTPLQSDEKWLMDVIPILHREILKGTSLVLGATVTEIVVIDDTEQVH